MNNYDIRCKIIEEELRYVWPEWHVAGHLGGGSFGDVFQIYRDNYGIRLDSALKVIQINDRMATEVLPYGRQDGRWSDIPEALRSEIQIMEALRGAPNIVSIEDFAFRRIGQTSTLFVRMELLTSLQEVLPGRSGHGTLSSVGEIRKLGMDVCRALMYCEKRGIIHRDIKPANLFVDRFGDYKVGDFGASKRMDTVHVAQTMTGIGTISYMAPEIFRGQSYNNTVDIYALGLVLYQLLNNGRMPFLPETGSYTTQDIDSANYRRMNGTPILSLSGKYIGEERVDSRLDAVVRKACAANAAERYQTAKEFYDALASTGAAENRVETERVKRPQEVTATVSSSQNRQQERERSDWEIRQQTTPQPGRYSYSRPEEKRPSNKIKTAIVISFWCIVAVLLLIIGHKADYMNFFLGMNSDASAQAGNNTAEDQDAETEEGDTSSAEDRASGPITDSWEEIIASGEDGTYIDKYRIGDTKELDLGDEGVIEMELVAFDADELADGSGKAHMTWIAKGLLISRHVMNAEYSAEGGWPASDMRDWLQSSILPLVPDPVRSEIKEVKKYSYSNTDSGTVSSEDRIWIPSHREILGASDRYENRGPEYLEAFPDESSRTRKNGEDYYFWWLRSAYASSESQFCSVYGNGNAYNNNAHYIGGVCVGFCL